MAVAWPSTLPQGPAAFSEKPGEILRTPNDSGPSKRRKRFTKNPVAVQMEFILTMAQKNTLEAFINSSLSGGVIEFTFKHPWTQTNKNFKFNSVAYSNENTIGVRASIQAEYF